MGRGESVFPISSGVSPSFSTLFYNIYATATATVSFADKQAKVKGYIISMKRNYTIRLKSRPASYFTRDISLLLLPSP